MIALLGACGGGGGDGGALPAASSAEPVAASWVVGVSSDGLWLEGPGHPRAPVADAGGDDPAVPALVDALKAVAVSAEQPFTPAVAAEADVPFGRVARVLVSLGLTPTHDARIRVTTPSGPGELTFEFPRFCGSPTSRERLSLLATAPTDCVAPLVRETPGGLRVDLVQVAQDQPGCLVLGTPTRADGWRGAVALPAAGACPSVTGRDPAALDALLARTAAYGPPCGTAQLSLAADAPWGEAVAVWQALRARHGSTSLGLAPAGEAGCAGGVPLP